MSFNRSFKIYKNKNEQNMEQFDIPGERTCGREPWMDLYDDRWGFRFERKRYFIYNTEAFTSYWGTLYFSRTWDPNLPDKDAIALFMCPRCPGPDYINGMECWCHLCIFNVIIHNYRWHGYSNIMYVKNDALKPPPLLLTWH